MLSIRLMTLDREAWFQLYTYNTRDDLVTCKMNARDLLNKSGRRDLKSRSRFEKESSGGSSTTSSRKTNLERNADECRLLSAVSSLSSPSSFSREYPSPKATIYSGLSVALSTTFRGRPLEIFSATLTDPVDASRSIVTSIAFSAGAVRMITAPPR